MHQAMDSARHLGRMRGEVPPPDLDDHVRYVPRSAHQRGGEFQVSAQRSHRGRVSAARFTRDYPRR